jgi:short-subunit dehydrogenase
MKTKHFALITGASGGIGKELAEIFASKGNNLILVARSGDKLSEIAAKLKQKYGAEVITLTYDLSRNGVPEEIYQQVKHLDVEYLVNNAGFGDFGYFHETNMKKEFDMISVNITALTVLTKHFVRDMIARGHGRIMNLGSNGSFVSCPTMAVYCATKNYVLAFSEALSVELKNTGVTVTCLCPGPTTSGFQKAANNENSRIVKGKKLPGSFEVAMFGYDAMMKGRMTAIHGLKNRLEIFSARFSPRRITALIAKYKMRA